MIQLSKKDYDYCKTVYQELLSGAYSKDKVRKAYEIMFGNKGEIIHNKKKRAQVFSYFSKELVELKPSRSTKTKKIPNGEEYGKELQQAIDEFEEQEKAKSTTKKKRTTKKKEDNGDRD